MPDSYYHAGLGLLAVAALAAPSIASSPVVGVAIRGAIIWLSRLQSLLLEGV